jgi:hypothetical protein
MFRALQIDLDRRFIAMHEKVSVRKAWVAVKSTVLTS